jgi:hypothetical protein
MVDASQKQDRALGRLLQVPGTIGEVAMMQLRMGPSLIDQFAVLELTANKFLTIEDDGFVFFRDIFEDRHDRLPPEQTLAPHPGPKQADIATR